MNGSVISSLQGTDTIRYSYATGIGDIHPVLVFKPMPVPSYSDSVQATTIAGSAPVLPSKVTVHYTDGTTKEAPVTWNEIDWSKQKAGKVKVSGTAISDGKKVPATAEVTVNPQELTITFDANGGSAVASQSVRYGSKATQPTDPTRTGHTFQGWYTARSGGSKYDFNQTVTGDVTLYAHWSVNSYTLTFDGNGGKATESSRTVQYGSPYGTMPTAMRTGYTFQGWYTAKNGGSKYNFNQTVTGDVTLYAHWSVNSYTLTFDGNGGKPSEASRTVAYGGQYGSLPTATRTGHTFQGWYTARNGGTKVSPTTTMGAADTTLYAHWAIRSYTVSFDANGGSAVASQSVRYGSKATQPTDPTRTGHTFQGWYTARSGGSKYDFNQTVTGDVTLYARWVKEPAALRRLSGATRYDTMEKIVGTGGWKSGGTVIVASGGNYPDALAASGLAGVLDAPIVLTDGSALSVQASARLTGLAPSRIIVVGGRAAVSDGVVAALRGICPDVERVAGETRVDTSLDLYRKGSGWGSTAILATSGNFADALSVSSYAYAAKAPVFLVDPGTGLTQAQKAALRTFKQVLVVGGENAVPSRHVAGLPGVTRLSGATRYETSERIAEWATGHGLGMDGVVYATGANFPDALAAGPLAGGAGAVTLLVEDAHSPAISFSAGYKGKVNRAYVVGGVNAVSQNTADAIADSLGLKHAQ